MGLILLNRFQSIILDTEELYNTKLKTYRWEVATHHVGRHRGHLRGRGRSAVFAGLSISTSMVRRHRREGWHGHAVVWRWRHAGCHAHTRHHAHAGHHAHHWWWRHAINFSLFFLRMFNVGLRAANFGTFCYKLKRFGAQS